MIEIIGVCYFEINLIFIPFDVRFATLFKHPWCKLRETLMLKFIYLEIYFPKFSEEINIQDVTFLLKCWVFTELTIRRSKLGNLASTYVSFRKNSNATFSANNFIWFVFWNLLIRLSFQIAQSEHKYQEELNWLKNDPNQPKFTIKKMIIKQFPYYPKQIVKCFDSNHLFIILFLTGYLCSVWAV